MVVFANASIVGVTRREEKACLRRDAVASHVIDVSNHKT